MEFRAYISFLLIAVLAFPNGAFCDGLSSYIAEALVDEPAGSHLVETYQKRAFDPIWLGSPESLEQARRFVEVIEHIGDDGLEPGTYYLTELKTLGDPDTELQRARLELTLTRAFALLLHDARFGAISSHDKPSTREAQLASLLEAALGCTDPIAFLEAQFPRHRQYARMKDALRRYSKLQAETGGWFPIRLGKAMKIGMRGEHIVQLRKRLRVSGDIEEDGGEPDLFDEPLLSAIQDFQKRHGLTSDGVVGRRTIEALNVPLADRIAALRVNLERWRWLDPDLGQRFVIVNIAGFELALVDNGQVLFRTPVIVGKRAQSTPVFSDEILFIEINPYWNVPVSIARNEILPRLKRDPGYFAAQNMRLFSGTRGIETSPAFWQYLNATNMIDFRIRQEPGPQNALGVVKFVFPNPHDVYLHDTPARNLFDETTRAFSHGCIRVKDPLTLAELLLGGESGGWSKATLDELVAQGENRRINLPQPVPVHILYRTAWVDPDDTVHFRDDIYGRDVLVWRQLVRR